MIKNVVSSLHIHISLFALAFVFVSMFVAMSNSYQTRAGNAEPCPGGVLILQPAPEEVLHDNYELKLYVENPGMYGTVEQVTFSLEGSNGGTLGDANPSTSNPGVWNLSWNTTSVANGNYTLEATVRYTTTTNENNYCSAPTVPIAVNNQAATEDQPTLRVEIYPDAWSGPTNVNFQFGSVVILVHSDGSTEDVTPNANFIWGTTIGSISGDNNYAQYFSGPMTGDGKVKVSAHYGGLNSHDLVDVHVENATEDSTYPDSSSIDSALNSTVPDETNSATEKNIEELIASGQYVSDQSSNDEGDSQLASCLLNKLDNDDYESLINKQRRLSYEQLEVVRACFAERFYMVPVNLAPVLPTDVAKTRETKNLTISEFKNVASQIRSGEEALLLQGKAKPGSEVIIYMFSEPLVITTKAGDNGEWSYMLENPLEPGDHVAYVVSKEDGDFVRSTSFPFTIAQAAASEANPNGYSLALVNSTEDNSILLYIASALAAVLVVSLVLARFVWFRTNTPTNIEPKSADVPVDNENLQQ